MAFGPKRNLVHFRCEKSREGETDCDGAGTQQEVFVPTRQTDFLSQWILVKKNWGTFSMFFSLKKGLFHCFFFPTTLAQDGCFFFFFQSDLVVVGFRKYLGRVEISFLFGLLFLKAPCSYEGGGGGGGKTGEWLSWPTPPPPGQLKR